MTDEVDPVVTPPTKLALGTAIAALLIGVALNGTVWKHSHDQCVRSNQIAEAVVVYIDGQVARSEKSLPTINYYMEHPGEAAGALADIKRQHAELKSRFRLQKC